MPGIVAFRQPVRRCRAKIGCHLETICSQVLWEAIEATALQLCGSIHICPSLPALSDFLIAMPHARPYGRMICHTLPSLVSSIEQPGGPFLEVTAVQARTMKSSHVKSTNRCLEEWLAYARGLVDVCACRDAWRIEVEVLICGVNVVASGGTRSFHLATRTCDKH